VAKLGFHLPNSIDARLRRFVPWGGKGRIIEGLLRVMLDELESGEIRLWKKARDAYWNAHK